MGLNRLKIGTRIFIGFGTLIAISLIIAGFGVYRLADVGEAAASMDSTGGRVGKMVDATRRLEAIRRAETRMRIDGGDQQDAKDNAALVRVLVTEAVQVESSADRRRTYAGVLEVLTAHDQTLDHFATLTAAWIDARAKLITSGDMLTAASTRLVAAARAAHDPAISEAAGDSERRGAARAVGRLAFHGNAGQRRSRDVQE